MRKYTLKDEEKDEDKDEREEDEVYSKACAKSHVGGKKNIESGGGVGNGAEGGGERNMSRWWCRRQCVTRAVDEL